MRTVKQHSRLRHRIWLWGHLLFGSGLLIFGSISTQFAHAAEPVPLVSLDARDPTAGTAVWANQGSLGPFTRVGQPYMRAIGGIKGVTFDGAHDAYRGPISVSALEGAAPRTIEVWAYNPNVESDEETLVTWGKRGGPNGTLLAFDWGRHSQWGAATHWSEELSWNGVPKPGRWHFLVYTYDGKTARVYDDGIPKNAREVALATAPGSTINLGAQNGADGQIQFAQGASLEIASVRVLAAALTERDIAHDFAADAARFGAVKTDVAVGPDAILPPAFETRGVLRMLLPNLAALPIVQPSLGTKLPPFRTVSLSGPLTRHAGIYYTAFTFTTPPGRLRQLRWYLVLPRNVTGWYLVPTTGNIPQTFATWYAVISHTERSWAPPGLTEADETVLHQRSEPGTLEPGLRYLMYFSCADNRPGSIKVSMTLALESAP